ncbi:hypothetical protein COCOBI_07-6270 [Coccomyxa sp. Obi]|nr:hypothetical protein COCOBI_07-6270 [Coccomyxa sp. Obi]
MEYGKLPLSLATYILIVAAVLVAAHFAEASVEGSRAVHRRHHVGIKAKGIGGSQETSRYGAQCGQGWQEQYARLHGAILQSEPSKQRFAVVELYRNGLGDRLTSAVAIFYYALLSGRAFRIDWRGVQGVPLTSALDKPNVDWEAGPGDVPPGEEGTKRVDWFLHHGHHPPDSPPFQFFGEEDIRLQWRDTRTMVFSINTGVVDKLFYNRHHRHQLFAWGLRPETAVGCALDFLFQPRAEVLDLVRDSFMALSSPHTLKIGIHVRMGDAWLRDKPYGNCDREIDYEDLGRWFRCASKVEEEYRVEGVPVHWYVVSDCHTLRYKAAKLYGKKVLLPNQETVTEHMEHSSGNSTRDILAFRTTVAEQWLLGMTDFQIITEESSYGRLAALRSLRFRSVYTMRSAEAFAERGRNVSAWECTRQNYDDFQEIAVRHPWVKIL